jgi:hypothetical protein
MQEINILEMALKELGISVEDQRSNWIGKNEDRHNYHMIKFASEWFADYQPAAHYIMGIKYGVKLAKELEQKPKCLCSWVYEDGKQTKVWCENCICKKCDGTGGHPSDFDTCPDCNGTGLAEAKP